MTSTDKNTLIDQLCEALIDEGLEGTARIMQALVNEAMKLERERALNAKPYERTEQREGYANGYKPKTVQTRYGKLELNVPKTRGISFYPQSLEKGCRSERALKLAIAQMYVEGVSTRKVTEITEALCGFEVSSAQVSRLSAVLDEELHAFRTRPLGEYACIYLDARYERVRHGGVVRDIAALWSVGVDEFGKRHVLGLSCSLSEAEVHWRAFLQSLVDRGLRGVRLIVSDDHAGLKAARKAIFGSTLWQRCQFHISQNAQAYVPRKEYKAEVAEDIREIWNSRTLEQAQERKDAFIAKWQDKAPTLIDWAQDNLEEGFTCFLFPQEIRKKIRTSNIMERGNQEIKRRTKVARLFPDERSCVRLVAAVLAEIHDEWITGRTYFNVALLKNVNLDNRIYRNIVA